MLAAAACLDLAKLAVLLQYWNWTNTMPVGPSRATDLLLCFTVMFVGFEIYGAFYFARLAWHCFFPPAINDRPDPPPAAPPPIEPRPSNGGSEPPEPRRCGVPRRPRPPGPLQAHCYSRSDRTARRARERGHLPVGCA